MKKRIAKRILKNQDKLSYKKGQIRKATSVSAKAAKRAEKAAQQQAEATPAAAQAEASEEANA